MSTREIIAPECEKLSKVAPESQKIGEFLNWLSEQRIYLSTYQKVDGIRDPILVPLIKPFTEILADYFEIDLKKVEQERQEMIHFLRKLSSIKE